MTNIPVDHREQKLAELLRAATNGDGTVDWSHAVAGYLLEHGVQLSEERPSLPPNAEDALANVVFDTVRMLQHAHPNVHLGSPQGVQWLVRGLVANGVRSVDSLRPPDEFAWLIEDAVTGLGYYGGPAWTHEHLKAVRYSRRQDAEAAIMGLPHGWHLIGKAVEHGWMRGADSVAAPEETKHE